MVEPSWIHLGIDISACCYFDHVSGPFIIQGCSILEPEVTVDEETIPWNDEEAITPGTDPITRVRSKTASPAYHDFRSNHPGFTGMQQSRASASTASAAASAASPPQQAQVDLVNMCRRCGGNHHVRDCRLPPRAPGPSSSEGFRQLPRQKHKGEVGATSTRRWASAQRA